MCAFCPLPAVSSCPCIAKKQTVAGSQSPAIMPQSPVGLRHQRLWRATSHRHRIKLSASGRAPRAKLETRMTAYPSPIGSSASSCVGSLSPNPAVTPGPMRQRYKLKSEGEKRLRIAPIQQRHYIGIGGHERRRLQDSGGHTYSTFDFKQQSAYGLIRSRRPIRMHDPA